MGQQTALDYEDDVHVRVNPLAPIPRQFGVNLIDPQTGKRVYFDDCFRYAGDLVDGDMQKGDLVEAKSNYEIPLRFDQKGTEYQFIEQAEKQLRVATARGVGLKWYFAEKDTADEVRRLFGKNGLGSIVITYMPPRKRK